MSKALAVFHGRFGRATVYQLNRPFNMHAHREGHLIFHVGGTPAHIDVCDERWLLMEDSIVAINPWEPHNFVPTDMENGAIFFVLYVNAEWFAPDAARAHSLRFGRTCFKRTAALDKHIRRSAALVCGAPSLSSLDCELRQLIDSCYEESWQSSEPAPETRTAAAVTDFRVRKSIKLMSESPGAEIELDSIAREFGTVAPAFLPAVPHPDRRHPEPLSQYPHHGAGAGRIGRDRSADRRYRLRSRLLLAKRLHPLLRRQCRNGADRIPPRRQSLAALSVSIAKRY